MQALGRSLGIGESVSVSISVVVRLLPRIAEAMLDVAHRFPDHGMSVRSACLRPEPKAYPSDCK